MSKDRPVVLLTGFGPFPTVAANATSILVPRLAEAASRSLPGIKVAVHVLPTEWVASIAMLEELTRKLRPAVAIHFGVSGRAGGFEVETRGRNACAQSEDAAGQLPIDRCISPGAPEFLGVTIPAPHIVTRLRQRGLPAQLSRDAGAYLCNALLYRSLQLARDRGTPVRSGFVHLPSNLVNDRRPGLEPLRSGRLGWSDFLEGGLEIITCSLGRPSIATAGARSWTAVNSRLTLRPTKPPVPAPTFLSD